MDAKQLPSGNWRVQVSLGKDANGKRIRKSVTAKKKADALRLAKALVPLEYDDSMLVMDACSEFLRIRGPELSPSTVRGYMGTYRQKILPHKIAHLKLSSLKTPIVQAWISEMKASPKTKRNHLGFLTAVVRFYDEDKRFRVKIADVEQDELYTPTMQEINKVLTLLDEQTQRAALLGVFGLRRGEICALDASDIDREHNLIRISKDVVKDDSGKWIVKAPKTRKSVRWVEIPKSLIDILPKEGPIISISPDMVTNRFARAVKQAGVPHFRLHDLRSFFASISISTLGVAEKSVQDIGGWKTSHVLKKHYERSISDQRRKDTDTIIDYFTSNLFIPNSV